MKRIYVYKKDLEKALAESEDGLLVLNFIFSYLKESNIDLTQKNLYLKFLTRDFKDGLDSLLNGIKILEDLEGTIKSRHEHVILFLFGGTVSVTEDYCYLKLNDYLDWKSLVYDIYKKRQKRIKWKPRKIRIIIDMPKDMHEFIEGTINSEAFN